MYTFKYEDEDRLVEVTCKHRDQTWSDLVQTYKDFLRACGFYLSDSRYDEEVKDNAIKEG